MPRHGIPRGPRDGAAKFGHTTEEAGERFLVSKCWMHEVAAKAARSSSILTCPG